MFVCMYVCVYNDMLYHSIYIIYTRSTYTLRKLACGRVQDAMSGSAEGRMEAGRHVALIIVVMMMIMIVLILIHTILYSVI